MAILLASCTITKKTVYFNDLKPTDTLAIKKSALFQEPTIKPDDILSILILTIDPNSTVSVNQTATAQAIGASSATQATGNQLISGFLVDKNGYINITLIGPLKVAGLTTFQAREQIEKAAARYYNNPNVQVRFANYKITVLGEVARPATYTVPNEKVSVLDALGLAGDLTIYGKRENVLLIRENGDQKEFVRLNLNSTELVHSSYFYLRQGDVLYVEPGKGKVAANNAARTQTISVITAVTSLLVVIASRLF